MKQRRRQSAATGWNGSAGKPDTLVLSGRALARQAIIYALGSSVAVPVGIVSLIITTRYLNLTAYGHLSALMAVAILITHIGEVGCLQGTLLCVYGVGGDGGDDDGGDGGDAMEEDDEAMALSAGEGRRLLGTGFMLTFAQNACLIALGAVLAKPFDGLLIHVHDATEVRLAVLCGASGAVWTFVTQLYRLERRVVAHVTLNTVRPILVIIFTVVALVNGGGVLGVLIATALANVVSTLIGIAFTFSHYRFRPQRGDAPMIYRKGMRVAPILIIAYVRNNLDVLLLNQAASAHVVGLYGVASKISQIPLYFSTAYLNAWAPMERSPIFRASRLRVGRPKFAGTLFSYLVVLNLVILVVLSLGADVLIRIAAPSYAGAASLIPWVAGATVVGSIFYATYRASFFRTRRIAYEVLGTLVAVSYAGVGYVLLRYMGVYAVPVVAIVAGLLGCVGMVLWDKAAGTTLDLNLGQMCLALGLAALVVGLAQLVTHVTPVPAAIPNAIALASFCWLLVATRIVPRDRLARLLQIVRSLRPPTRDRKALMARWPLLTQPERDALAATVLGPHRPVSEVALQAGVPEPVIYARIARGLRHLNGLPGVGPMDARIGAYLLSTAPTFERDWEAIQLSNEGAALEELYTLDDSRKALRAAARMRPHESLRAAARWRPPWPPSWPHTKPALSATSSSSRPPARAAPRGTAHILPPNSRRYGLARVRAARDRPGP